MHVALLHEIRPLQYAEWGALYLAGMLSIHDYGKDGGMYIMPGCIANVNWKLLNKDETRSANDEK